MLHVPPRTDLGGFAERVNAIVPSVMLGFARPCDDGRVSVLYWHPFGVGEYLLETSELLEVLLPPAGGPRQADGTVLRATASRALEWLLLFAGVERLVSLPIPGRERAEFLWVGSSDSRAVEGDRLTRLEETAESCAALLDAPLSPHETAARLRGLELAGDLLPAILRVLDVREVFERLSAVAKRALPHDLLVLRVFNEDVSLATTLARTGTGIPVDVPVPQPYPAAAVRAWNFDLTDDHLAHPLDRHMPPAQLGARSSVRFPIRYDNRLIGGLAVLSLEPFKYSAVDIVVGRYLADHVAVALSHYELAQRLAEHARSNEELRARTTSLELLDQLLTALGDTGDVADVFDRIMMIAGKVLPHDAARLMVDVPGGRRPRVHATHDFPTVPSGSTTVPEEPSLYANSEHELVEELANLTQDRYVQLAKMGFRSLLAMPIRIDGRAAAALTFLSKTPSAFRQPDVLVARRVADRLAVTVARDREIAASRRAEEAVTRADEAHRRAGALEARVNALAVELNTVTGYRFVIGESPPWKRVLKQATQVAATDTTTLLLGESGTGKEVVSRFIHRASARSGGPFVALNCAALPEPLLESELFGFERGAFTGALQAKPGQLEQAAGGVLFLDEVGEMTPSVQAKFLRVLQEREFQRLGGTRMLRANVRVVAATNRNLRGAVDRGTFREDLYYRLNVFEIHLPPLRERTDDILPLSEAFLKEIARAFGRPPAGIAREAREALLAHRWPGNVRELRNVLERAAIVCEGGLITTEHLTFASGSAPAREGARDAAGTSASSPSDTTDLRVIERSTIERALLDAKHNKSLAAKKLGLTRKQLYVRLRQHGLE